MFVLKINFGTEGYIEDIYIEGYTVFSKILKIFKKPKIEDRLQAIRQKNKE